MADFHMLDPAVCDLSDLGRPAGFVGRQVRGWKKRWDLVADPEHDAVMCAVHARLEASIPSACHTFWPVVLLSPTSSPLSTLALMITRSPTSTGDVPLPQPCVFVPTLVCHNGLPASETAPAPELPKK